MSLRSAALSSLVVGLSTLLGATTTVRADPPRTIASAPIERHVSTGTGPRLKATAGPDTVCLYGGPGSLLGKFQDAGGLPDDQGWFGVDATEQETLWQRSTTNAENLNANGPGNHAMWAGRTAAQHPGWSTPPGYGNSWNAILEWRATMLDPSVGQTVTLDFVYNVDSEPAYDFFEVEVDSAGLTVILLSVSGTNRTGGGPGVGTFPPPGETANLSFTYAPNGYPPGGEIVLRMRGSSDGAYSDEDGEYDSEGLVQVDDITVVYTDGVTGQQSVEDFEGSGPYAWEAVMPPYAGQFGRVFESVEDIDPCRENDSPVWAFVDDGLGPYNDGYTGTGTGGTTDPAWTYGPGGYVFPSGGGITSYLQVHNSAVSPVIEWDLPGSADDGPDLVGAVLRFDVWEHLPLFGGVFYSWSVRGRDSSTGMWSNWANRGYIYFNALPAWRTRQHDVTDLLPLQPSQVQMRLEARDNCTIFGFPCFGVTPAPYFDSASLFKYRVQGPMISARAPDLLQDSFPNSGSLDLLSPADLSCRLDMARDVGTGSANIPGDSIVVTVTPTVPGTSVARVDLKWVLDVNPEFAAVRSQPVGTTVSVGTSVRGWDQWFGTMAGASVGLDGKFTFDLPHDGPPNVNAPWQVPEPAMFFPGDRLRYYVEAEDSGGRISTLPRDISGFDTGEGYSATFTVRALPDVLEGRVRSEVLYVAASGPDPGRRVFLETLETELRDKSVPPSEFDVYLVQDPSARVSNGLGSAGHHGATVAQLAPYRCIVLDLGRNSAGVSDGSNDGLNDKSDDISLLEAWKALPGDRAIAYLGNHVVDTFRNSAAGTNYVSSQMGVEFVDTDVSDDIGQTAPDVSPLLPGFWTPFSLDGVCPSGTSMDAIRPSLGVTGHRFIPGGFNVSASVVWSRQEAGRWLVDVTFPFALSAVGAPGGPPDETTQREVALELLGFLEHTGLIGPVPPGTSWLLLNGNRPNPFNPATTIHFKVGRRAAYRATVYNARGLHVRDLFSGPLEAGDRQLVWDGRDDRGRPVASGMYVVEIKGDGQRQTRKMALLK